MEQKEESKKDGVSVEFESSGHKLYPRTATPGGKAQLFVSLKSVRHVEGSCSPPCVEAAIPLRKGMDSCELFSANIQLGAPAGKGTWRGTRGLHYVNY